MRVWRLWPVVLVALLPPGAAAQEAARVPTMSLAEYRAALGVVATVLERGEWASAREAAAALRGAAVADGTVRFEADPVLLSAVEEADDAEAAARARIKVQRVLASLGDTGSATPGADAARLARLAREEAARRPRAGGTIDASLDVRPLTLPERLGLWIDRAARWLVDVLRKIGEWLARAAPRRVKEKGGGTAPLVGALVAAIAVLLAVAAVRSARRRDLAPAHGEATETTAERDADPLSREADEWERYASELAAAGRRREAIRAFYHAVLVTLFRTGRLHHQKGRTNWEYVAQITPEVPWRGAFVSLTEVFDREWYGREASSPEALRECAARAREVLRSAREGAAA